MTRSQVIKAMAAANIPGEVTGAGKNWEVELPNRAAMNRFQKHVCKCGGHSCAYGGWILSPNYQADPFPGTLASRSHY